MKLISLEQTDDENFRSYGSLNLDDAVEVIEEILLLHHTDVFGLQKFGTDIRKINVSVSDDAFYRNEVQECLDERVSVLSGKIVTVCLPNTAVTEVYVKHAPMDWSVARFTRIFSFYGDIKKIDDGEIGANEILRRGGENYVGKTNGIRKIRMKIRKQIPSSLTVDDERIEIYHRNQVRTCFKCGGGHLRKDCPCRDPKDFKNRFTLDQFPLLPKTKASTSAAAQGIFDHNMSDDEVPVTTPTSVPDQTSVHASG